MRYCSNPTCPDRLPTAPTVPLKKCAGCAANPSFLHAALYCSVPCQKSHWKVHKEVCPSRVSHPAPESWVDAYRSTCDGMNRVTGRHMGDLELVTWDFVELDGTALGWGAFMKEEEADNLKMFHTKFGGDVQKFLKKGKCHNSFRWTCCGMSAAQGVNGCDHHGDLANLPCTCDFCGAGRPLPQCVYAKQSTHNRGLTLRRGPDARSRSAAGEANFAMREAAGISAGMGPDGCNQS
ncbi:hypothetical protein B484DRAFT_396925 [Ochromonadaceae sp. CCMP2298]|nr:hypothetical protein B484DRAFT_396925 [Ochromonadaceae sp. CCMP2298]